MHKPRHNAQSTLARASLGGHARSDEVRRPGTVHGMCTEGPRQVGSNLTKPAAMWAGFRNFVTTATRSIHGWTARPGGRSMNFPEPQDVPSLRFRASQGGSRMNEVVA